VPPRYDAIKQEKATVKGSHNVKNYGLNPQKYGLEPTGFSSKPNSQRTSPLKSSRGPKMNLQNKYGGNPIGYKSKVQGNMA
jgi:hypothetical protein